MSRIVKFTRILLKLSGEALGGPTEQFNHDKLVAMAQAIHQTVQLGVQVGIVIGAGNIFRARSALYEVAGSSGYNPPGTGRPR